MGRKIIHKGMEQVLLKFKCILGLLAISNIVADANQTYNLPILIFQWNFRG